MRIGNSRIIDEGAVTVAHIATSGDTITYTQNPPVYNTSADFVYLDSLKSLLILQSIN